MIYIVINVKVLKKFTNYSNEKTCTNFAIFPIKNPLYSRQR
jgi:hypothetical protein